MIDVKLAKGEVHVWLETLDWSQEKIAAAYKNLLPTERKQADRYRVEKARRCAIISSITLRNLLAKYLKIDVQKIELGRAQHGKPYLIQSPEIKFNLSHSKNYLVLAVTLEQEVGIDIEFCEPRINHLDLAKRFFSTEEYQQLISIDSAQQLQAFYNGWVRKEAFIKGTGDGLSFGLSNFVVDLAPEVRQSLLSVKSNKGLVKSWIVQPILTELPEYKVALAVQYSEDHPLVINYLRVKTP